MVKRDGRTETALAVKHSIAELVASGSIGMGFHALEDARRMSELLPSGTRVYINHLPGRKLTDALTAAIAVRDAGLEPVIHIAARQIKSRSEVTELLDKATRFAKISKIF